MRGNEKNLSEEKGELKAVFGERGIERSVRRETGKSALKNDSGQKFKAKKSSQAGAFQFLEPINRPGSYAGLQSGLGGAVCAAPSLRSDGYVRG